MAELPVEKPLRNCRVCDWGNLLKGLGHDKTAAGILRRLQYFKEIALIKKFLVQLLTGFLSLFTADIKCCTFWNSRIYRSEKVETNL